MYIYLIKLGESVLYCGADYEAFNSLLESLTPIKSALTIENRANWGEEWI